MGRGKEEFSSIVHRVLNFFQSLIFKFEYPAGATEEERGPDVGAVGH